MTVWHPPRSVLELVELAATAAIGQVPLAALSDAPDLPGEPGPPGEHQPVTDSGIESASPGAEPVWTIEDAEGTGVAELNRRGVVRALRPFAHGPLRGRRVSPAQLLERDGGTARRRLAVVVDGPITSAAVARLRSRLAQSPDDDPADLLWLPLVGQGRTSYPATLVGVDDYARWRVTTTVARSLSSDPLVIPLALPAGYDDLLPEIVQAYGAELAAALPGRVERTEEEVLHPAVAAEGRRIMVPPSRRGVVVFFTGLSGSGKSTVAKAFTERLLESGSRRVTLLDGDEVRRMLSAGLGFSAADREANIRRIGFVAAEVSRHGGVAVCAPIAPFAATRAEVRDMVRAAGGDLVLVHVATPLAECERRDRKGLYAKARAGLIPEFTGISSPYEEPTDADLRVDTTNVSLDSVVDQVWGLLKARGYLTEG